MSDQVGNPEARFSHVAAQLRVVVVLYVFQNESLSCFVDEKLNV